MPVDGHFETASGVCIIMTDTANEPMQAKDMDIQADFKPYPDLASRTHPKLMPTMMTFDTLFEQRQPLQRSVSSFDIYLLLGASACVGGALVGLASILRGRHVNTLAREIQKDMRSILSNHAAQQARIGHEFRSGLQKDLAIAQTGKALAADRRFVLPGAAAADGGSGEASTLASVRAPEMIGEERSTITDLATSPTISELIQRLKSLEQKIDHVVSPKVENVLCDVFHMLDEIRADVEKIQQETENNPGDNAELIEIILRDVLEEKDVKDHHTEQAEKMQVSLASLGKVVREQHMASTTSIQSVHKQLNVLKDSVAGIESRLGAISKELEGPNKDEEGENASAQPTRIYDLLQDFLSPLANSEICNVAKPDRSQRKSRRGPVESDWMSTNPGQGMKDQEEPVLVYSDGSLGPLAEEAVQAAYATSSNADGSKPYTADTPEETPAIDMERSSTTSPIQQSEAEDMDTIAARAAQAETKETAFDSAPPSSAPPSTPPGLPSSEEVQGALDDMLQNSANPMSQKPAYPDSATEATAEQVAESQENSANPKSQKPAYPDSATEATAEQVAESLDGPIKRYGMISEKEKETIYKEIEMHFRSLRFESQGLRREYQTSNVTVGNGKPKV